MTPRISDRISNRIPDRILGIQGPMVPIIADLIQKHPGTVSLGQGVVHYGPPPEVGRTIERFFDDPKNHLYTPDWGIPSLVESLAKKLTADNAIDLSDRSVIVTAGANMGFVNAVLALTDPGDEVILLAPFYFNHEMAIQLAGCVPRIVHTDQRLIPNLEAIDAAVNRKTRAVVTVSPNNPTGVTYPAATLRAVNDLCRERGIFHISDEAYEYFVYDDAEHYSPASGPGSSNHTVALYSLSKSYGFASWRVGYMVVPADLFDPVMKIQDTNVICAPAISQHAAVTCLEVGSAYCRGFLGELAAVRGLALDALQELGDAVTVPSSDGAFYVYLRVNRPLDPLELTRRLIAQHGVAVIPGSAFGSADQCYLRVSYGALKKDQVHEGIGRLVSGLRTII